MIIAVKMKCNMNKLIHFAIVIVILTVVIAGFLLLSRQRQQTTDKLSVTATYYPVYEFSKQVGGDKVTVQNITPAGTEPHDFEPSPRQLVAAQRSEVFVYNGAGLEPWVENFLENDYKNTVIKVSEGIPLLHGDSHEHEHKEEEAHEEHHHGEMSSDPHFWLDPIHAERIIDTIAKGFSEAQPQDKAYFQDRANQYKAKLEALHNRYVQDLSSCQSRSIVTSHGAFNYLAKRYDLDITPIAGVSPDEEPSAAKLAEVVTIARQKDIQYIFFESLVSPRLADTIARETGAKTAVFDPIEGISNDDQSKGANYLSVQRKNLQNLRTALNCQ